MPAERRVYNIYNFPLNSNSDPELKFSWRRITFYITELIFVILATGKVFEF
jgi:hypothetical protein